MNAQTSEQEQPQLLDEQSFLERRGIRPGAEGYSTDELTFHLSRRGWRWQFDSDRAEATKALTASGSAEHTIVADNADTIANLSKVLAEAIRFDEAHGFFPPRPLKADFELLATDGEVVALVEANNSERWTPDDVTAWRRYLLKHGLQHQEAPYFFIVSQDIGYFWDQREGLDPDAPPTLSFSMKPVTQRYASWLAPGDRLRNSGLELIVQSWLYALTYAEEPQPGSIEEKLAPTGFLGRLRNAEVRSEFPE